MARSRKHPTLLVVGVALAGGLIWWTGASGSEYEFSESAMPAGGLVDARSPVRGPAELAAAPLAEEEQEQATQTVASPPEEAESRAPVEVVSKSSGEGEKATSLEGRVLLPALAPADDRLEVFLFTRHVSAARLHDEEGAFAAPPGQLSPEARNQVAGRTLVDADGSFEIDLPESAITVHLAVRGRFVYSDGTQPIEVGSGPAELEARLGGAVRGRVTVLSTAREVDNLAGTLVQLKTDELSTALGSGRGLDPRNMQEKLFERHTTLTADGSFELGGVPPSDKLKLVIRPEELAFAEVDGIVVEAGKTSTLETQLSSGAVLSGRVIDEGGTPVAEVEVRAHRTLDTFGVRVPGESMREATSAADGSFELRGLMPGEVRVVAEHDAHLGNLGEEYELADGQYLEVTLSLERGESISGIVILPDGRGPAVGARLEARREVSDAMEAGFAAMAGGQEGNGETDDEGRFEIPGLAKGRFEVRATWEEDGDGAVAYMGTLHAVAAGSSSLSIELEPPILLGGLVVDEAGEPVQAFQLSARQRSDMPFLPTVERERERFESEDGTFIWGELFAGVWTVEADAEGFGPSEPIEIELPRSDETPLQFVLPRNALASGVVLGPKGSAVPGAEVTLELDMMDNLMRAMGQEVVASAESDDGGAFSIQIPPGERALIATHPDWADSAPVALSLASSEVLGEVVLQLRRGALLTGEVFDKEGELAAGVGVILRRPTGAGQRFTQSDRDGFFTFERVTPGDWQLVAMVGEMNVPGTEDFDIGEMMSNMHIAMLSLADGAERHMVLGVPPENPVRLLGEVYAAGEPLPDVMISFFRANGGEDAMSGLAMTQAGEDGRFEIQLDAPGKYVLSVQQVMNMTGQQQSVEFREDVPATEEHRIRIEMPSGSIGGRVVDAKGEPVAGVRVSLTNSDGFTYGSIFGGQYADVRTDQDGRYELSFLREGNYTVGAAGPIFGDGGKHGRVVRSGIPVGDGASVDGVDFELDSPGKIRGTVRDASGKPVAETALFLRDENGSLLELFSMIVTDGTGKFDYSGVSPGRYTISAQSRDLVSTAPVEVRVKALETTEVEMTVDTGTTLLVALVDKTGAGVDATVRVVGSSGQQWSGMMSMSRLLELMGSGFESAEQKVGPLPPGTYEVRAIATDGREAKKKVTLGEKPERKVRLRLRD